jgi:ATP-dependent helicase/DNAse subunit B
MNRGITVVAGPARSGKTGQLLARYRAALASGPPGSALWLAPTHRAAAAVRGRLVGPRSGGLLNPQCLSIAQFARRVLEASTLPIRPLSLLGQRRILQQIIDEFRAAGRLEYFEPIARTSGFLDLVVGFISELKRLEIWPHELRAARGSNAWPKDRELFALYEAYQRRLNEHDLYDAEGRFWSARAQLRDGHWGPFAGVRHVLVDGFVDFTRTEHEVLTILAERAASMTISLPWDVDAPRRELFAKSAATLAELERRHPALSIERADEPASDWPPLAAIQRTLFAASTSPRTAQPVGAPQGIEIVAAGSATSEVELLARRIKALLVDGDPARPGQPVSPADVLVVFRTLPEETVELVREVFGEYGIPAALGGQPRLARSPLVRTVAAWLDLVLEDWPYRELLALVVHHYFCPAWPEWRDGRAAEAAEYAVRRLQIASSRAALLTQLERLAARAEPSPAASAAPPSKLERQALLAWPLLRRMAQMLDALPERATHRGWARALATLARESGMLGRIEPHEPIRGEPHPELLAWQQLLESFEELERLANWLGEPARELSLREVRQCLQEVLHSAPLPEPHDETGRVLVLSAESARHLSAPYVFVAGLAERAFPPADREDCLYGEAETRELARAGLPLPARTDRRAHEMLLFYQIVTRATRQLVLSYPALDESAQPLSPSPYVIELERSFGGSIPRSGPPTLSVVPATDVTYGPRDFRLRAVDRALAGEPQLAARFAVHPTTAACARGIAAAVDAIAQRGAGRSFGPFEGMLTSERARAVLAQTFGPQRCWSPSQFEQYALCPHQFFLERVLGIEAVDDPVLAVDYAARGRMLHWVLATLHRRLNEQAGGRAPLGAWDVDELGEQLARLADEWSDRVRSGRPLLDGLLAIDVRRLQTALADYHQQHAQYDALGSDYDEPLLPVHFEVSFGPTHRGDDAEAALEPVDPLSSRDPFELACGSETICFAGRIDRIDLGVVAGRAVFAVIDYKSGRSASASVAAVMEGMALQLPLYALAAQKLLSASRAIPLRIGYWHVEGTGAKEVIVLHQDDGTALRATDSWRRLESELPARVWSLVSGIRDGQFPMASADEHCTSRCAYHTVCRVNQARSLGKQWQPPREECP